MLSGFSVTKFANNFGATREKWEAAHGGNGGGGSVWWKWVAPNSGRVTITTAGSLFDTLLGVYAGSSLR